MTSAAPRYRVLVVGIGAGGLDQVTVEAVRAINEADVFIVADKTGYGTSDDPGAADLIELREAIIERHLDADRYEMLLVPDPPRNRSPRDDAEYDDAVRSWHAARAEAWAEALHDELPDGGTAVAPVWGDPALYDSTIRILERIRAGGLDLDFRVIPGISSVALLAARHRLVLNRIGGSVLYTTGRRLAGEVARHGGASAGGAAGGECSGTGVGPGGSDVRDYVVMLDGRLACADLPGEWDVYWGANLGTPDEQTVAGRLAAVLPRIRAARERARAAHGWVMDVYLLRAA